MIKEKSDMTLTPAAKAWHDAYAAVEMLWEESRDNNEDLNEEDLHTYRSTCEEILEEMDSVMQDLFPEGG